MSAPVTTVSGRVQAFGCPPGQPEAWVSVSVVGHEQTQYLSGADVTCDGVATSPRELILWLLDHTASVTLTVSPPTDERFQTVTRAEFTGGEPT